MLSKVRLQFLKKMIILGPKTAILGPQFCRILVLGPQFWWSGGAPLDPPLRSSLFLRTILYHPFPRVDPYVYTMTTIACYVRYKLPSYI